MKTSKNFSNFLLSTVINPFLCFLLIQGINISIHPKAFIYSNRAKNNLDDINNLSNYLRKNVKHNHLLSKGKK